MYTVLSREQPASRRRALVAGVLVLGLTTGLAAGLVAAKQAIRLGPRVAPPDWPVSFEPPLGWPEARHDADYLEFTDWRDRRNPKRLILHIAAKPRSLSAEEIAMQVMRLRFARLFVFDPPAPPEEAPLGPLPGARVSMPQTGDYVHVALLPPGEAQTASGEGGGGQVLILRYHTAAPFTARDLQFCRRLAASIQPAARP